MRYLTTRIQCYAFLALIGISLALRLWWVLFVDPHPILGGGDAPFYLHLSEQVARGRGLLYHEQPVAVVGPIYPLYLAALHWMAGTDNIVLAARVSQAVIGSLLVGIIFAIGRRWAGNHVGLVVSSLLAVDLRFISEVGSISTETLFTAMLALSLWVYLEAIEKRKSGLWLLAGILLGVATLTRAVVQFLPVVLLLHMWLFVLGWRVWRQGALLVAGFAIIVSPWVIRNWIVFGHPKIIQGAGAHFWMGARDDGMALGYAHMMEEVEPLRIGEGGTDRFNYVGTAVDSIMAQPIHYMGLRLRRMVDAYLQPYGTVIVGDVFGSDSLKGALRPDYWQTVREIVTLPVFWPKLWIYLVHYGSIVLAVLYIIARFRKWRHWMLWFLVIGYFSGVYAFLTVIPRYLFPVMPLYLLLASALLVDYGHRISDVRLNASPQLRPRTPRSSTPLT